MRSLLTRSCLLPAVLLGGCAAPPFVALALDGVDRIDCAEVADTELFDVLRLGPPSVGRTGDGRLQLDLAVYSLDDEPLDVLATVRFVDRDGRTVRGGAVRRHLRLLPDAATSCAASAPGADAVAFVVAFDWDR